MGLISGFRFRRCFSVATGVFLLSQAVAVSAGPIHGRVYHPEKTEVEQTFAIGLKSGAASKQVARDVVILIDTSASQMGDHREFGFSVLKGVLNSLSSADRVRLVAVDVSVEDLSNSFVAADSEAIATSLKALENRVPLGATNFAPAVEHAISLLSQSQNGALLYIGDGMSRGQIISKDKVGGLISSLQKNKIAVHGFGVGPVLDFQLLGTLANFTGGIVKFDNDKSATDNEAQHNGAQQGQLLATAIKQIVEYPTAFECNSATVLPTQALPLRSDRETIYLARGTVPSQLKMVTGESISLNEKQTILNVLDSAWNAAQNSNGLKVSFAGSELLLQQEKAMVAHLEQLGDQAERAIDLKNYRAASGIGQTMAQLNPGNKHAQLISSDSRRFEILNVSQPQTTEDLEAREGAPQTGLLLSEEQRIRVNEQRYAREVELLIEDVNKILFSDPESVIAELKRALTHLSAVTNIGPDIRDELIRKLKSKLADAQNRIEIAQQRRIEIENQQTQLESRRRTTDQLLRNEDELEAWMDRIRGLLADAVRGNDDAFEEAQAVAHKAIEGRPKNGTAMAAMIQAEALTQLNLIYDLNVLRRDRWLAALEEVEKSHVPFPDEPPIAYPPPEIWQALTQNRQKWKQVSIFKQSPREQRIREELDRVYELEVSGLSLQDALDQIADTGGFQVVVHNSVTDSLGDLSSFEIEQNYSGIRLRSILRLLLGPQELTYAIKNEVLYIITEEEAMNNTDFLQLKIYPVTDLVIPIQNQTGGQGINGGGGNNNGGNAGGNNGGGNFSNFSVPDRVQNDATRQNLLLELSKKKAFLTK